MTQGEGIQLFVAVLGAGLGTKILSVLMETRDSIRDHIRDVGTKEPATGLFRKVAQLRADVDTHDDALARLGFDRRHGDRRGESDQ